MSAPALAIPELPESTGWSPIPNSMWDHLWRRVEPAEFWLVGFIARVSTASVNAEILRDTGIRRMAVPEKGDPSPRTGEEFKRLRVHVPLQVLQQGSGYLSDNTIRNGLRNLSTAKPGWTPPLGVETDDQGRGYYWLIPENFSTGPLKPPKAQKKDRRHREVSILHTQRNAALTQPIASPQPIAYAQTSEPQSDAERNQLRQTFETGREGEQTHSTAPQSIEPQSSEEVSRQPNAETAQSGANRGAAHYHRDPAYPLVSETGDERQDSLASQPQTNAQGDARPGEQEAAQMNAALPELVNALGPMSAQTALNLLAAGRAALVMLVIAFIARKYRLNWAQRVGSFKGWGIAVSAVQQELRQDIEILVGHTAAPEATPPSIEEQIEADLRFLEVFGPDNCNFEAATQKLKTWEHDHPDLVAAARRKLQQRE